MEHMYFFSMGIFCFLLSQVLLGKSWSAIWLKKIAKDLKKPWIYWIRVFATTRKLTSSTKGRIPLPNWMIFGKMPNGLWPPPSFLENYIAIFYNGYGRIYTRRHRPDSISWYQLISIQLLKQYTLNPVITLLFINFMLKKPSLKFPKSAI